MNNMKRNALVAAAKRLGLKLPQLQLLVAQDHFMGRIAQTQVGKFFVWKGGSLIMRAYRHLQKPRFTTDIDLLVKNLSAAEVANTFAEIVKYGRDDDLIFKEVTSVTKIHNFQREGRRFSLKWEFQGHLGSQNLTSRAIENCFKSRYSKFDKNLLSAILADSYYMEEMEKAKERNFSDLVLPSVTTMFAEIELFATTLT